MPHMQKQPIDRQWFIDRLAAGNKSVRGLARHLDIDASAVSRMLSGQRRMKMEEADAIARFLGSPVNEVLTHAGVAAGSDANMEIMLSQTIDEEGRITGLEERNILPKDVIERAYAAIGHHSRSKICAAQVRAESGPLAALDDAVMFYISTDAIEPTSIGTLSVCETIDGDLFLAKVDKARKTGEATLRFASDETAEHILKSAAPIIAIIP